MFSSINRYIKTNQNLQLQFKEMFTNRAKKKNVFIREYINIQMHVVHDHCGLRSYDQYIITDKRHVQRCIVLYD